MYLAYASLMTLHDSTDSHILALCPPCAISVSNPPPTPLQRSPAHLSGTAPVVPFSPWSRVHMQLDTLALIRHPLL